MKKTIAKKGYTVEVTSWENDGDNYRTQSKTYDSKELAVAVAKMCKTIFVSENNGAGGIGNCTSDGKKHDKLIINYMKANPILSASKKIKEDDDLIDICMDYNYSLMGGSEYYYSRVCEKVTIFYCSADVEMESIKF